MADAGSKPKVKLSKKSAATRAAFRNGGADAAAKAVRAQLAKGGRELTKKQVNRIVAARVNRAKSQLRPKPKKPKAPRSGSASP